MKKRVIYSVSCVILFVQLRRKENHMSEYAHPEVLVTTDWIAAHAKDPGLRLVEVDVDTTSYEQGHIDGAIAWNWQTELQDAIRRDLANPQAFEGLLGKAGISPETTIVLYGDNNNWFAAWAFWQLKYYGHEKVLIVNGGRKKWLEEKRPLSTEKPAISATTYKVKAANTAIRAKRDDVLAAVEKRTHAQLVDVRSADEFSGKIIAPPGMTETAQRGGHIPGAASIPWAQAVNEDGTFKSIDALNQLYAGKGISGEQPVIAYCRIGERSSHTWFVLKYLLGIKDVRNYDGSWTEWGNLIGAPIEKEVSVAAAI
jgi:thiosulfate/3-mercaptopyruvate sulfurtransferase